MDLAIVTPSRGLVHSRTIEAVLANVWFLHPRRWKWFLTHDLPIPDCFEDAVGRAYESAAPYIWIVEEDVQPAPDALLQMLAALGQGADVAVIDYVMDAPSTRSAGAPGDGQLSWGVERDGAGRIAWTRTGCILLRRACLDALPRPWFTRFGRLLEPGGEIAWQSGTPTGYGVDVEFTHCLIQLGFVFQEVRARCDHLRVVKWGQPGSNDGWHRIEALPGVPRRPNVPPRRHSYDSTGR